MTEESAQYHGIEDQIANVTNFLKELRELNPYQEGRSADMHKTADRLHDELKELQTAVMSYFKFKSHTIMDVYLRLFEVEDYRIRTKADQRFVTAKQQGEILLEQLKKMAARGQFDMRDISPNPNFNPQKMTARCGKYASALKKTKYEWVEK
jgi:hypothetical protein